ncbi:MAG TPA: PAS and helix-turn-helix domain-containing protein [Solirubrobacteraceae bacterium]|nr:PAS and helix-turn-helix domain-containing protein [Solirubrobacteraceae bacterium]
MLPVAGARSGWSRLFWEAFTHSKNAMVLLDDHRHHVEVNGAYLNLMGYGRAALIGRPVYEFVVGGPIVTLHEWRTILRRRQFAGEAELVRADGGRVWVEFAGHPEIVTEQQLVLFVVVATSRRRRRGGGGAARAQASAASLTPRELEVVHLVALGLTGREVAQELHLAHDTVRTHIRNAMNKLGARSRAQLVAKSLGEGVHWRDDG